MVERTCWTELPHYGANCANTMRILRLGGGKCCCRRHSRSDEWNWSRKLELDFWHLWLSLKGEMSDIVSAQFRPKVREKLTQFSLCHRHEIEEPDLLSWLKQCGGSKPMLCESSRSMWSQGTTQLLGSTRDMDFHLERCGSYYLSETTERYHIRIIDRPEIMETPPKLRVGSPFSGSNQSRAKLAALLVRRFNRDQMKTSALESLLVVRAALLFAPIGGSTRGVRTSR